MAGFYPTMCFGNASGAFPEEMANIHSNALAHSRPAILDCLDAVMESRSPLCTDPIQIADFGTADGVTSLPLIHEMITIIQTRQGKEQTIMISYNDHPMNDFNRLCQVLLGQGTSAGLADDGKVFRSIIPKSMYGQCLPDNSVDLAISSIACHYISKRVCGIGSGVFFPEMSKDKQDILEKQAREDWRTFVMSRGRELKTGGYLAVLTVSSNDDKTNEPIANGLHAIEDIIKSMVADKVITQDEYTNTTFNAYAERNAVHFREPFQHEEVVNLGLELVSIRPITHFLRHHTYDTSDKDERLKTAYADRVVASLIPWMHHVILQGLSADRTEPERRVVMDQFCRRAHAYAFSTSDHKPYLILTEVIIKKTK